MTTFASGDTRILLVAADKATLFIASGGHLTHAYEFAAGEAGVAGFARYLQEAPSIPTSLLVDVVEEEYRPDTMPHVRGADRRAVLARKFARQFRGTPYSLALTQGREPDGRQDDRVLLTALTKPENVTPWLAELTAHKTPLIGIYSLPILSASLLPKLKPTTANVLVISVQAVSGLRQTFFREGQLKISRLAPMPRLGAVPYANHLLAELAKLRRYLNSLALAVRDSPLAIYVLSHGELLSELEKHCRNSETEQYLLVDTADLAQQLGLPSTGASAYSDAIFVQLLLQARPRASYAQRTETRYYRLLRMKWGLIAASLIILLGSAGWSALRFIDAVGLKQQAQDAESKALFYQERYKMARRGLPPTAVDAPAIQTAVEAVHQLAAQRSTPALWLRVLGAELATMPNLAVDKIEWYAANDPTQTAPGDAATATPSAKPDELARYSHYNIGILHAHVVAFEGDFRAAIATVDSLAVKLRSLDHIQAVEVTHYPLDVRPASSMAGTASGELTAPTADFALKIVLGVPDGRHQG